MIANFFEVQYIDHQNKRRKTGITKAIFPRMFISIMPITLTANAAIVQYILSGRKGVKRFLACRQRILGSIRNGMIREENVGNKTPMRGKPLT